MPAWYQKTLPRARPDRKDRPTVLARDREHPCAGIARQHPVIQCRAAEPEGRRAFAPDLEQRRRVVHTLVVAHDPGRVGPAARQDAGVPGRRLAHGMVLVGTGEHRALADHPRQSAGELGREAIEVVRAHLVHDDRHHQRRPVQAIPARDAVRPGAVERIGHQEEPPAERRIAAGIGVILARGGEVGGGIGGKVLDLVADVGQHPLRLPRPRAGALPGPDLGAPYRLDVFAPLEHAEAIVVAPQAELAQVGPGRLARFGVAVGDPGDVAVEAAHAGDEVRHAGDRGRRVHQGPALPRLMRERQRRRRALGLVLRIVQRGLVDVEHHRPAARAQAARAGRDRARCLPVDLAGERGILLALARIPEIQALGGLLRPGRHCQGHEHQRHHGETAHVGQLRHRFSIGRYGRRACPE